VVARRHEPDETNFVVNEGCSGTLIDLKERFILTANHCVAAQFDTIEREKISDDGVVTKEKVRKLRDGSVSQLLFDGTEVVKTVRYKVKLIAVDRDNDLALLQVMAPIPNKYASPIACKSPVRGERVYTVGNPMGVLYSSITTGIVSSAQRDYEIVGLQNESKAGLLQISGGVVGGNSGGSVYNTGGKLVGVPVLAHRVNEVLGFAVPLVAIKKFLKANNKQSIYSYCEE
jgi:S1-C subfamily serine protease